MSTAERTEIVAATRDCFAVTTAAVRDGAAAMAAMGAGYVPFALVIGVAAGASVDPLAAWAGSVLVFAGSAHLLLIDLVSSGARPWAAVAAAVAVNARLLVFSATLAPLWRSAPLWRRLVAAAVVIDPVWALTSRRLHRGADDRTTRGFYAGAAGVLLLVWPSVMAAGAALGGALPATGSGAGEVLCLRFVAGGAMMWAAVVAAGLGTYLLRALPLLLLSRRELSPRTVEALQHAATGAMAAMLVMGAAQVAGASGGAAAPPGRVVAVLGAVGTGLWLGRRGRSMPVVVAAGLGVFATVEGAVALLT